MSDFMQDPLFEQELNRLRPAAPPPELMHRLAVPPPVSNAPKQQALQAHTPGVSWVRALLRVLVPVSAAALVVTAGFLVRPRPTALVPAAPEDTAPLVVDEVTVDSELVNSFEAVAELPTGEPVRVRCREWMDNVFVRDDQRGIIIQQHKPRMEVLPVRFETY